MLQPRFSLVHPNYTESIKPGLLNSRHWASLFYRLRIGGFRAIHSLENDRLIIQVLVLPYREYMRLLEICEEADDCRVFDEAIEAIRQGEELVPAEVVNRLIEGENPMRVWREHVDAGRGCVNFGP